ncbi:protein-disulfide isomerase [Streptosporangium becharense]|uniref:Protein-disulfide isomerase n=1 Tax=Streptosporangium becharense TaxID=1816182 RepID=A0A7W9IDQ5_9ACTN|nr:thioredoxin domain-containing protein [Streptosporangium becharense]MBB2912917.1 protein-disulfide isomerase [Streptosporangium becharense]MBB5818258.1 protein-disulfide isomerase [Streptosporangium becharense]
MGKGAREQSARDRIKAQREEQQRKDRARRITTIAAAAVVAIAAVGAGWWYAAQSSKSEEATAALAPVTVAADGSVVMAKAGVEKPVLDVYEDFQCPACQSLEKAVGPTIKNLAAEGKAKVVFHPITIFPQEMNNGITRGNSVRAAVAARCVPGGAPWLKLHDKIFEEQPAETAKGFEVADLVAWGKEAGVTDANFEKCVTGQEKAADHDAYSKKILETQKLQGTPTLKLDGTEVPNDVAFSPSALRQTVLDAAK